MEMTEYFFADDGCTSCIEPMNPKPRTESWLLHKIEVAVMTIRLYLKGYTKVSQD